MAKKPTILINALQYKRDSSGIGILLRELFGLFIQRTEYPCQFVLSKGNSSIFPHNSNVEIIETPFVYEESFKRILYQSFLLGTRCNNTVLLTVDSKVPLFLPRRCRLLPLITDLAVFRMPEVYQGSRVFLWKHQFHTICHHATHFLAISEFTKKEMVEILGISPEHIDIVSCAASSKMHRVADEVALSFLRSKYQLPEHFILFVGNFNPRKNITRLISAFDQVKQKNCLPYDLVIAGSQGWKFEKTEALSNIANKESIHFIGYVPDEDMPALYSAAEVFAFPTLYEGFGIPVIEAQICGTPVLTSNTSSLPEIAGDTAVYVDPYSEVSIADGLLRLLTDNQLRNNLIEKGYRNANRFSWEASVQKLEQVLTTITEGNSHV